MDVDYNQVIYAIICHGNGKKYVGRTHNPRSRFMKHMAAARSGRHSVEDLNSDFKKYGEQMFTFHVLQRCQFPIRADRNSEKEWMDLLNSTDRDHGYNYKDPTLPIPKYIRNKRGRYARNQER